MVSRYNPSPLKNESINGLIFDIRRYSIHDGPGIRTAVFFKGCPLDCRWCHNPEGRSSGTELIFRPNRCILCDDCLGACPNEAIARIDKQLHVDRSSCKISGNCAVICPTEALEIVGRIMTVDQVLEAIEKDRIFYEQSKGGVTFTGGEPLTQPGFLHSLLVACNRLGISCSVDTSGYSPWSALEAIHPLVELFLYDLKLMDDTRHRKWTSVSNEAILSNLRRLSGLGCNILVRIPIIPGINDDEENLRQTGEFLSSLMHIPPVQLLAYHNIAAAKYTGLGQDYLLEGLRTPTPEQIQKCAGIIAEYSGVNVVNQVNGNHQGN